MTSEIENLVMGTLPRRGRGGSLEAYRKAANAEVFPRLEIFGEYQPSMTGSQMVYALGWDVDSHDGKAQVFLYYLNTFVEKVTGLQSIGGIRELHQIREMPADKITSIRRLPDREFAKAQLGVGFTAD